MSNDSWAHIEPDARYTPQISVLVQMMNYARMTTLHAVQGLTTQQLDAVPQGFSNSIGMLLAHIAAVDRLYHHVSFEERAYEEADPAMLGALSMGTEGPPPPTGQSLNGLLAELEASRAATLKAFGGKDDRWLASRLTVPGFEAMNHHWAWFHVMEDEVSHRGQIRILRKQASQGETG
ncbi:DinB family protein [Deinococcus aerophilus]|uniref:DUF664 domain-containing protein n=1 Tax=Deinococcus aerophilus TaxID=522488 RepID=A0ABQ2GLK3_9DEIO|nr:DinB family protein [Deinococcus aerophilus]GGM02048.1 hypothetical protein GCM10010841_08070 [Deinococcus aerophilus]